MDINTASILAMATFGLLMLAITFRAQAREERWFRQIVNLLKEANNQNSSGSQPNHETPDKEHKHNPEEQKPPLP